MTELLADLATWVSAAAIVVGVVVLPATKAPRTALGVTLDLLLAAGLLRLSASLDWPAIGAAAAIIAVRKLVSEALRGTPATGASAPAADLPR